MRVDRVPVRCGKKWLYQRVGAANPTIEKANGYVCLKGRCQTADKLVAPGALFRPAKPHEQGRRIFRAAEFGNDIAVRHEPIQCHDI